jgi:hypothetical protein
VLSAFEKRIDEWYLAPVRILRKQSGGHGAFAAMSICCLLIDCLCQFDAGKVTSNRTLFIDFICKRLPHYDKPISPSITFPKIDSGKCCYDTYASGTIKTQPIDSIAKALYFIYRCGILHSAHAPLCGAIQGLKKHRFSIRKSSLAKYSGIGIKGTACPVVVIDPWKLFVDIEKAFKNYLARLKSASPTDTERLNFNEKFADAFGIDVSAAT